jgi:hypothetical protein
MFVEKMLEQPGMRAAVFLAFPQSLAPWQYRQTVVWYKFTEVSEVLPASATIEMTAIFATKIVFSIEVSC